MGLEKYYLKLPDFIKFNPRILKLSFDITDKINNFTGVSTEEYLSELSSSDGELNFSATHLKFRSLYVELLIFIDNVCRKHEIDYWLGFGTLLGAVRHGGFIPWDDDIDLVILREDYNRLIEVLPEELVKYGLDEYCGLTLLLENRKNYFNQFRSAYDAKDKQGRDLVDGKYNFLQIAWLKPYVKIDIFPFDFIEDDKLDEIYDKFAAVQYKFHNDLLNDKVKFLDEIDSVRKEVGFTDSRTKQFSDTIEGVPHWKIRIFDYDKTFPLTTIRFEGHEFKCPKDCNHHLTRMFGPNYMDYPKVIYNHDTLGLIETQFNSKHEMDDFFDNAIDFLKKVNNSFK
ncbi:MAG: LicD family protein [Methanobrevibacter sp.]|uniref:LicD family protein n=1 Tax=Methanobrevibacter sp. TaxID=66852 RepID=UPI0025DC8F12|nr:LicD family protein [Methanobrevibacter sp.]MBQ8016619.1 LicD family protein [Methanobrevibacter sp.]